MKKQILTERELDRALSTLPAVEPSADLLRRVAEVPLRAPSAEVARGWPLSRLWPSLAAWGAAAALGVVSGLWVPGADEGQALVSDSRMEAVEDQNVDWMDMALAFDVDDGSGELAW